jgi:hypothetical protein
MVEGLHVISQRLLLCGASVFKYKAKNLVVLYDVWI